MKTYTILHRWNQLNDDGCELVDTYLDKDRALREMRSLAEEDRKSQEENGYEWDGDFCQNSDTYISYELHKSCKLYDCDHTAEALDTLFQELKTEWA